MGVLFENSSINSSGAGGVKSKAPGFSGIIMRFGGFFFLFSFSRKAATGCGSKRADPCPLPIVFRNFKAFLGHLQRRLPFSGRFPSRSRSARPDHPSTTRKKRSSFYHTTPRDDKQTRFHDCGTRRFDLFPVPSSLPFNPRCPIPPTN